MEDKHDILLSDLVNNTLLSSPDNECFAYTLGNGLLTLWNESEPVVENRTLNYPALFIQCHNNLTHNASIYYSLIHNSSAKIASLLINDDSHTFLMKDNFSNGTLMIAFILSGVCVGSWMLFLVLLLLPANNHNKRKKLVYVYVLYFAISHTVILRRTTDRVFNKQYTGDYQDADYYNDVIIDSNMFKIVKFFSYLLCDLNWVHIVYYMFHNYRESQKQWVPKFFNNNNKRILIIGAVFTIIHIFLYGMRLWYKQHVVLGVKVVLKICEYSIFASFTLAVVYYVWHDFGFTLAPKRIDNKPSLKMTLNHIWQDYHQTIPLLIYNAMVFLLLYLCSILQLATSEKFGNWMSYAIGFIKLLITVNIWGLIGVLERRERILSKETLLGRKINNKDRFFVDPMINYGVDEGNVITATNSVADINVNEANGKRLFLKKPMDAWRSRLKEFREKKQNPKEEEGYNLRNVGSSSRGSHGDTYREQAAETVVLPEEDCDSNDSMDTVLTRNFIFDHDRE